MENAQTPLWKNLKILVSIDQERKKVATQIKDVEQEIAEDNQMLPELEAMITHLKQKTIDAKKNVDLQELNAEQLKDQEIQKRNALDAVTKQKEYSAIEKEIKSLQEQSLEQEDLLVKAWHNLELAEKKESDEVSTIEGKIEQLKNEIVQKQEQIEALRKKDCELELQKSTQAKVIPEEWLLRYERMGNKVADPIVPVLNTTCSSCFYSVPPQDLARLKRHAILPCRSCYRLLYYDQEEEQNIESESF